MKKTIMSLGALLLSGAVLASCGMSASSIKKPNKGKAVDSVSFKTYDEDYEELELSFKKGDSFDDVMTALTKLPSVYISKFEDEKIFETGYAYKLSYDIGVTQKNYYESYSNNLYNKMTSSSKASQSGDYYNKIVDSNTTRDNTVYSKMSSTSSVKTTKDKYSEERTAKVENGVAGTTSFVYDNSKISSASVDGGVYEKADKREIQKGNNLSNNEKTSSNVYKYLKASENRSDPTYNQRHYGYDIDGTEYSYRIQTFLDEDSMSSTYYRTGASTTPHISSSFSDTDFKSIYNESMQDYIDGSFELTDKFIIIKATMTYHETIYREAVESFDEEPTETQIKAKYDELLKNEYKGTKSTYEIWLDYTTPEYDDKDHVYLSNSYLKATQILKANKKDKYDDKYFKDNGISDQDIKNMLNGKEFTTVGYSKMEYEMAYNTNDYSKKIKSMKDTCKKNNIFDSIVFISGELY